ncbi:McrC family protein [Laceyella putida]|uniref:McrC family protein n=1 Tax=Laceyella putida TaxID=110101 RepID=A0ABW2RII2_9BACL
MKQRMWIELVEHGTVDVPRSRLSEEAGEEICQKYARWLDLEFPSLKTKNHWRLKAKGWIGFLPLQSGVGINIRPQFPQGHLFQMLEVAYRLKSVCLFEGDATIDSLDGFCERVAHLLALAVLRRHKQGLHKEYVIKEETLPYIRGRWEIDAMPSHQHSLTFPCSYEDLVVDNEENRIILWTLYRVLRRGYCIRSHVVATIRKAVQALADSVSLQAHSADDCLHRRYHRLNRDYAWYHALCRFLLDMEVPSQDLGQNAFAPFLIYMPRLYEMFVAEWMKSHLPERFLLAVQEKLTIAKKRNFTMDLVIYDRETNKPLGLVDTKYKRKRRFSCIQERFNR